MSDQGNTVGKLYGQTAMSRVAASSANPAVVAETAAEISWWSRVSGWVHAGLDGLGVIPELGAVFDGANALIYTAEGDLVQAGISGGAAAADLIPVVGTAGKITEFGLKGAAKLSAKEAAEQAAKREAKVLAEKEAKRVAEQEAKQAAEQAAKKAEKEAAEKAEKEAASKGGKDGGKVKGKGRCTLRPYKPDTCKAEGKTGHHVVADRAFRLPGKRTGSGRRQISGGLSEGDGLVICLEGKDRTSTTEHGKAHALYDAAELAIGMKGNPPGTTELWKLEATGAASVAAVTKCNPAELMAQLRAYHQLKGMGPNFKVRADPTGGLTKGMELKDFAEQMKTGAGDF
ncbi:hypothetical protein JAO05_28170 [Burkholderia pseudomallei]|uniref:hypothetical protein n=1 Tax=Burkholderia pseudomallei TaxID=28450 RepID=UPI0018DD18F8|nr:hypothetical protein [Burkholderia pseudomallei]MBH9658978.1 hypothetical protein [Burkholderia pseudomallei]